MSQVLRFGRGSQIDFDLPPQALVAECGTPRPAKTVDPFAAVEAALNAPLGFPPLAQAVVPGDHVTLAVDAALPQAAAVVQAVTEYLERCGIEADDITVLAPAPIELPQLLVAADSDRDRPRVKHHDATSRTDLAYLAADSCGEPLYLNRALCDADLVLPIGCQRLRPRGTRRQPQPLLSAFCDAQTQKRMHAAHGRDDFEPPAFDWLLGVQCALELVPGPGGTVLEMHAGEPEAARRHARQRLRSAWRGEVPRQARLVVAAIPGDRGEQSWTNLGRALAAAAALVEEQGAIAVCCELDALPSPAIQRFSRSENPAAALQKLRRKVPEEALLATQLHRAKQQATVYLLSELEEPDVERLGFAFIAQPQEVSRLASRHPTCTLLSNAQHARVEVRSS